MNREEARNLLNNSRPKGNNTYSIMLNEALNMAIKALEQEPCEMTAEEYRQRMIQAFHNADTDELIAICVLPTEKEFKHLEWLLKNHYKKEPCGDAIDRSKAIMIASGYCHPANVAKELAKLPPVNPTKTGWIPVSERLPEDSELVLFSTKTDRVFEGRYFADNTDRQWYSFRDECFAWNNVVTAWMPLPEPYEPQEGANE